jgi:hypothetical protein
MNPEHMPPPAPQSQFEQLQQKFETFLSACKKLTPQEASTKGVCGQWSAKAVVDHLTGWQMESLPILSEVLKSKQTDLDLDIDGFNSTSVSTGKDLTWDESLAAFEHSFKAFNDYLGKISVSQYKTNAGIKSWIKAMIHEYQFHLQHIQQAGKF